jgi:hypothetical protein
MLGLCDISQSVNYDSDFRWTMITWSPSSFVKFEDCLLNAAGTPMIKPFPEIASLRFTLLPGEPSARTSRLGMLSPTLTKARCEV